MDGDTDSTDAQCVNALDDDESGGGAVVGVTGGTVTSDDGYVSVTIPSGALSKDEFIEVTPLSTTPSGGIGTVYNFTPEGTAFELPVTITIAYDELDLPVGLPESGAQRRRNDDLYRNSRDKYRNCSGPGSLSGSVL